MSQAFTPGFGAKLAAARESRGMTVAEMAERLKLTPRQIEALEAEDWTGLPDPVFVRGFVRNYAKIVGVATEELLPAVNGVETVTQTITAPSAGVRLGSSPVARWLMLPLLLVILFVTVVVGLYTWLRQGEHALLPAETALPAEDAAAIPPVPAGGRDAIVAVAPQSAASGTLQPMPATSSAPLPDPQPAPQPTAGRERTPVPPAAPVQAEDAPTAPAAAPRAASAQEAAEPTPAGTQSQGPVSMRFAPAEDSWIQVVDAKGMRFSKLVRGGSSEVVSGTPPFRLVVGNAATVSLVYNGHVIDLKPYIGEKVARLTLE